MIALLLAWTFAHATAFSSPTSSPSSSTPATTCDPLLNNVFLLDLISGACPAHDMIDTIDLLSQLLPADRVRVVNEPVDHVHSAVNAIEFAILKSGANWHSSFVRATLHSPGAASCHFDFGNSADRMHPAWARSQRRADGSWEVRSSALHDFDQRHDELTLRYSARGELLEILITRHDPARADRVIRFIPAAE